MLQITDGQCGMCKHYGAHHAEAQAQLVQLRTEHSAPDGMKQECGHPKLEPLHLTLTPIASCDGYERAAS